MRAVVALLCASVLAACAASGGGGDAPGDGTRGSTASTPSSESPSSTSSAPRPGSAGRAARALAALPVKGRAPMTGYSREAFGPAWADVDGNGCDTRDDVLRRDLTVLGLARDDDCVVTSGMLTGPYTGATIRFVRGRSTSARVQVDHVVALANAWVTGAWRWPATERVQFANDPLNLLAVDGPVNEAKGAGDAATWLPPDRSFRCAYVARQTAVKRRYHLWLTPAEKAAITRVLRGCPGQSLPTSPQPPRPAAAPSPRSSTLSSTASSSGPVTSGGDAVTYDNCTAARAAGAAPLRRGEPGYRPGLDGDGDGTACE